MVTCMKTYDIRGPCYIMHELHVHVHFACTCIGDVQYTHACDCYITLDAFVET